MKQGEKRALLLVCALLASARLLLPEQTELIRTRTMRLLGWQEGRAAEALDGLGDQAAMALGRRDDKAVPVVEPWVPRSAGGVRTVQAARAEEAAVLGEFAPTAPAVTEGPEPEEPAAVAAFLESQAPYADQALPDSVDYGYVPLPFPWEAPVSGVRSSGFGFRTHPIQNVVKFHYGTDLAADSGAEIHAFADGTVTMIGYDAGYGNYLMIDHGGGWQSLSAHCSSILVEIGQQVRRGDTVALVGATGRVTGPHLHFELTRDGVYRNPEYYLNG